MHLRWWVRQRRHEIDKPLHLPPCPPRTCVLSIVALMADHSLLIALVVWCWPSSCVLIALTSAYHISLRGCCMAIWLLPYGYIIICQTVVMIFSEGLRLWLYHLNVIPCIRPSNHIITPYLLRLHLIVVFVHHNPRPYTMWYTLVCLLMRIRL